MPDQSAPPFNPGVGLAGRGFQEPPAALTRSHRPPPWGSFFARPIFEKAAGPFSPGFFGWGKGGTVKWGGAPPGAAICFRGFCRQGWQLGDGHFFERGGARTRGTRVAVFSSFSGFGPVQGKGTGFDLVFRPRGIGAGAKTGAVERVPTMALRVGQGFFGPGTGRERGFRRGGVAHNFPKNPASRGNNISGGRRAQREAAFAHPTGT